MPRAVCSASQEPLPQEEGNAEASGDTGNLGAPTELKTKAPENKQELPRQRAAGSSVSRRSLGFGGLSYCFNAT